MKPLQNFDMLLALVGAPYLQKKCENRRERRGSKPVSCEIFPDKAFYTDERSASVFAPAELKVGIPG